jgi:ectoine hydroxylase-related dioxygenase (phytanoyl-CoA dioxygenase family)
MNRKPLNPVTDEDIAQFERDGVICLRSMFDAEWIERMNRAVNRIMDAQHPMARPREVTKALGGKTGRYHINTFVWMWDDDFRAWALESPMAEIAARMMRAGEVRLFYDQVFVKEPQTNEMTDWHQDLPFWPMRGGDILSIWVALTPVSHENSAVEYIAGSHKWGKFYAAAIPDKDPRFKTDLEPCPNFSERRGDSQYKFLSWNMEPGDCLIHHPLTVHGAEGNFSPTRRRVGISTRYFGRDCQWDPRAAVMKVTGDPQLPAGRRPEDDKFFPVAYRV